jgi:hypothetical protein
MLYCRLKVTYRIKETLKNRCARSYCAGIRFKMLIDHFVPTALFRLTPLCLTAARYLFQNLLPSYTKN